ncbi:MAG: electron transport complex subunit RsxC [Candidatus Omnitrophica bacterium]|nr:electron transport complex subunit RsxC [Candidatus Omnitrophota bacterium]
MKIEENKEPQHNFHSEKFLNPRILYLHLSQHTGKQSKPLIKVGDLVEEGEVIASEDGYISSRLHAPAKGKVIDIADLAHPILKKAKAIVIECLDQKKEFVRNKNVSDLSKEELLECIRNSGIVGMGGAAFPTHVKLNPPKKIVTLIINGCECEPYLAADYRLMVENIEGIFLGIEIISKILQPKNIIIAVEDNKKDAIKNINSIINLKKISLPNISLKVLKTEYPQGGEKQLIYTLTKKVVPSGKLPFDVGCLVQNVSTCFAIYQAVYYNKPLIERLVTFAGDALVLPKNIWVKIGTTLRELFDKKVLEFKVEPKKIICGGPMMGIALDSLDYPILKATSGFLFLNKPVSFLEEKPCIRCGECIRNCPMGLMPCLINLYTLKQSFDEAKMLGALDCIECGVCSFVCPAKRFLVQSIKNAKLNLLK